MKKIFIIAGEPSGDYLGSKLISDLNKLSKGQIEVTGIGGRMMSEHMNVFLDMSEITVIGIAEILPKLFKIKNIINETVKKIAEIKPDVIITIDFSGFNHRVAKRVKKIMPNTPIVHYVAPPVWAWRPWRAKKMHNFIDLLLTLFPFEPIFFEKFGLKSVFVGHPITNDDYLRLPSYEEKQDFCEKYKLNSSDMIICFLPGSRDSEIKYHVPIMNKTYSMLKKYYKNVKVIIPTLPEKVNFLKSLLKIDSCYIVTDLDEKNLAMNVSSLAVAASGTVNLELAKSSIPTIVIYKTSWFTAFLVKLLIKINYVSIINILAGKEVVPELLQDDCTPERIFDSIKKLNNPETINLQRREFNEIIELIKEPQSMLAAKEIINIKF